MSVARMHGGQWVPRSRRPFFLQPAAVAVLGAMTFNLLLCFVNTNVGGIGNVYVIGCEITIISAVLLFSMPMVDHARLLVIGGAIVYLVGLAALRMAFSGDALEIKPVRDFLIPIAFFLLGARSGDVRLADKIVRAAGLIVVAVGLFEYLFPDTYTRVFNIAGFYSERGAMSATQVQQSSNLFVSGMRPDGLGGGRNLLPFLGDHRVSSIFLEPVSAGNFGIIVFMWALVRSLSTRKIFWSMFASALFIIVMSDSRFGANTCVVALLLALCPAVFRSPAVMALPIAGILGLVFLPDVLSESFRADNGFVGRVIMSGTILARFGVLNWFGLKTPDFYTFDSGYSNVIGGVGIIGFIIFWVVLFSIKGAGRRFYMFRDLAGAYFALLLCISNSPFTIKTGALLWFLLGVLSRDDDSRPRTVAVRRPMLPLLYR